MAIRRATTASGNRPTYEASRSEEASHADLASATMHALFNEPLQGESANTSNIGRFLMGKSKKNRAAATNQTQHKSQTSAEAFSFGDPIPVLDRPRTAGYVECVQMDRWYEPPVSF